jgi:serine O-acetyltransferase
MLHALIDAALWECCPPEMVYFLNRSSVLETVALQCEEDAIAFASKDPAARGRSETVIASYTSFKAVAHYRLAHALVSIVGFLDGDIGSELYAMLVSSRGKLLSGAELHPRCHIGRRFVLDHGVGTVFGETTKIGDDCYVLGGVILGASGIAGNPVGKRHPTIGDRVQIGAFARIFGPVSVGDDVFVGPHSVITEDIPPSCVVTVRTRHQVVRAPCVQSSGLNTRLTPIEPSSISTMVPER